MQKGLSNFLSPWMLFSRKLAEKIERPFFDFLQKLFFRRSHAEKYTFSCWIDRA